MESENCLCVKAWHSLFALQISGPIQAQGNHDMVIGKRHCWRLAVKQATFCQIPMILKALKCLFFLIWDWCLILSVPFGRYSQLHHTFCSERLTIGWNWVCAPVLGVVDNEGFTPIISHFLSLFFCQKKEESKCSLMSNRLTL